MQAVAQELMFTGCSLVCAGIGSVHDVRERRIPNFVTAPAVGIGLTLHWMAGGWVGLGGSALAGAIAGGLFLVLYLAGGMGAGDVKLMAAVGCLVGLAPLQLVMVWTAIAGGLFGLALAVYSGRLRETLRNVVELLQHHQSRGLRPHSELNVANAGALRIPFALPIAAGCLVAICTLAWEARP
jgi:prepilin peptidase CpaA